MRHFFSVLPCRLLHVSRFPDKLNVSYKKTKLKSQILQNSNYDKTKCMQLTPCFLSGSYASCILLVPRCRPRGCPRPSKISREMSGRGKCPGERPGGKCPCPDRSVFLASSSTDFQMRLHACAGFDVSNGSSSICMSRRAGHKIHALCDSISGLQTTPTY